MGRSAFDSGRRRLGPVSQNLCLNLLADFQLDMIKVDMNLVSGIESRGPRQSMIRAIATVCNDRGIDVVPEGVGTLDVLRDVGRQIARPARVITSFRRSAEPQTQANKAFAHFRW